MFIRAYPWLSCLLAVLVALGLLAIVHGLTTPAVDVSSAADPRTADARTTQREPYVLTQADFDRKLEDLKARVPKGFAIVQQRPFIVIGDEPAAQVRRRATETVKWAVDKLKAAYFKHDPEQIIEIWLFRDAESYQTHCQKLFGKKPGTPFGFFSAADQALLMDISTGGGTLVHEIVHPFIAANYPGCPAWLNEGLASLYEQCGEEDGEIWGYKNWRLPGLQKAIRAKKLPPFQKLCGMSAQEFYGENQGAHYAQARYLCYYLQRQGLLKEYVRACMAEGKRDPSGYKSLMRVLKRDDMAKFQAEWEAWVLELRWK